MSRRNILKALSVASFGLAGFIDAAGAQESGAPETSTLRMGYVPVTCATPILAAHAFGFFRSEGLEVELYRTPSWALVRDKLINGEYDASQLILPMPLAISLGVGSAATPIRVAAIENTNGSAIVLHRKHQDRQSPKDWKGLKFGIPFEQSIHNLLLRYVLAEHGLDPDTDVSIRVMPPADTVSSLQAGNLDGMLFAEPWGQRAVFEGAGFFAVQTRDLFPNHPCCAVCVTERFATEKPKTYSALIRSMVKAINFVSAPGNRGKLTEVLSGAAYFNQPKIVLDQVLSGRFADGLGNIRNVPDRIGFNAQPSVSAGVWMMTQMKRWGYVQGSVDYAGITTRVFSPANIAAQMSAAGAAVKTSDDPIAVMGKAFDPSNADAYLGEFPIKKVRG